MNWREIIKPGKLTSKHHTQYTKNTQNRQDRGDFEDIEDIEDRVSTLEAIPVFLTEPIQTTAHATCRRRRTTSPDLATAFRDFLISACNPTMVDAQHDYPSCKKAKPSPVAVGWLQENRKALDSAGWTRAELYRRDKYRRGIAWLALWDESFSSASLRDDGTIVFLCSIHGRNFVQTAHPQRRTKR